jgi:tetratricopeptide (TPR) repeat protein
MLLPLTQPYIFRYSLKTTTIFLLCFCTRSFSQRWNADLDSANNHYQAQRYSEAQFFFAKTVSKIKPKDSCWEEVYYKLGYVESSLKTDKEAQKFYKKALLGTNRQSLWYAQALNKIGVYFLDLSQNDSAAYYLKEAALYAKKLKYAAPMSNLRQLYMNIGQYKLATQYALETMRIDEANRDTVYIASSYTNLGEIQELLHNPHEAIRYYNLSITIQKPRNLFKGLSRNYESLGRLYEDLNKFDKATAYYKQALACDKKINNKRGMAYSCMFLGNLATKTNRIAETHYYFHSSESIFRELNNKHDLGGFLHQYGKALVVQKQYIQAITILNEAVELLKPIQSNVRLYLCYQELSRAHEGKNDYKQSSIYYKLYRDVKDSIENSEVNSSMQNLTLKYEVEQNKRILAEQRIKILEDEQDRNKLLIIGILCIGLLGAGFTIYNYRQRLKVAEMKNRFEHTTKQLESFNLTVSHELRYPIVQMRNSLSTLKGKLEVPEIKRVEDSLSNMDQLIQSMLQFSKAETEPLNYGIANTKLIVEDIVAELKLPAEFEIIINELPVIKADIYLLRQVFVNLIHNAIKFSMKQPQPIIEISAKTTGDKYVLKSKIMG